MTLNYTGRCKASNKGGPRIASHICGPAEGVTVITAARAPTRADLLSPFPSLSLSLSLCIFPLLYLALTLLRGNLLINSQLVSAARRLINRRRVARWRHAQNTHLPAGRDLRTFILKHLRPRRHSARLSNRTAIIAGQTYQTCNNTQKLHLAN